MKNVVLAFIVLSVCTLAPSVLFASESRSAGISCLSALCTAANVTLDEKQFDPHLEVRNLDMLAEIARKCGVKTVKVRMGVAELAQLKKPAIVQLWQRVAFLQSMDNSSVSLLDPPGTAVTPMQTAAFKNLYAGYALMLDDGTTPSSSIMVQGPALAVDNYVFDFGMQPLGTGRYTHTFTIGNAGTEDLVISAARATCSCTSVALSGNRIAPGKTVTLSAAFDSTDRHGAQAQRIYLQSNDPLTPLAVLTITGILTSGTFDVSRPAIDFPAVERHQGGSATITVYDTLHYGLKVLDVKSNSPYITATLRPPTTEDTSVNTIEVTIPPDAPLGRLNGEIQLTTNHEKRPSMVIPVTAMITGNITCSPAALYLGIVSRGNSRTSTITVSTLAEKPFRIVGIDVSSKALKASASTTGLAKSHVITVSVAKHAPAGEMRGQVVIHTDDPDQPSVILPVSGILE